MTRFSWKRACVDDPSPPSLMETTTCGTAEGREGAQDRRRQLGLPQGPDLNTCGFIDDAVKESLDAVGEALADNGKVIVTGCLGAKSGATSSDAGSLVREIHASVAALLV